MAGLMNSLMIAVSIGLQYGVPPEVYVSKLSHMRFEPSGLTNDADIRTAKSIVDYIFRWFGKKFLTPEQQEEAGILSPEVKARLAERYANGDAAARRRRPSRPRRARPRSSTRGRTRWMREVRRPDGAHGLVLHLPRLRDEHRLLVGAARTPCLRGPRERPSWRPQAQPERIRHWSGTRVFEPGACLSLDVLAAQFGEDIPYRGGLDRGFPVRYDARAVPRAREGNLPAAGRARACGTLDQHVGEVPLRRRCPRRRLPVRVPSRLSGPGRQPRFTGCVRTPSAARVLRGHASGWYRPVYPVFITDDSLGGRLVIPPEAMIWPARRAGGNLIESTVERTVCSAEVRARLIKRGFVASCCRHTATDARSAGSGDPPARRGPHHRRRGGVRRERRSATGSASARSTIAPSTRTSSASRPTTRCVCRAASSWRRTGRLSPQGVSIAIDPAPGAPWLAIPTESVSQRVSNASSDGSTPGASYSSPGGANESNAWPAFANTPGTNPRAHGVSRPPRPTGIPASRIGAGRLARIIIRRVQTARPHALRRDLLVQRGEVRVERLRRRPVRVRLHLVGERLVLLVPPAERVRRVDRDLPSEPRHLCERLRDRARRDGDQDDLGVRRVPALAPEGRHLVARLLPEPGQPAADVAPADGRDLHGATSRGRPLPGDLTVADRGVQTRRSIDAPSSRGATAPADLCGRVVAQAFHLQSQRLGAKRHELGLASFGHWQGSRARVGHGRSGSSV